MKEKTKNTIGIVGLVIVLLAQSVYNGIVIAEFYTARHGEWADAKVIDVSKLCQRKNKSVKLLVDGKRESISVYGRSCRSDEFPLHSWIKVRVNRQLNIVTIPGRPGLPRVMIITFITVVFGIALAVQIKQRKRLNRNTV